jgi:hypothetical protein
MPPDYQALKFAFRERQYLFTEHASERAAQRAISSAEIEAAVENGEVIEDYPGDKYGPSCLVYGKLESGRELHLQISYPSLPLKIITVYEPDPDEWENGKVRKE